MGRRIVELNRSDCTDAAAVQRAIDTLRATGGVVRLPEVDLPLDRGLELYSGIELTGCGERTILRQAPGRVYPLTGYHNYGMRDVPLSTTEGLSVGMTAAVLDDRRKGFYSTFNGNAGNGLHPGAGSTDALFEDCSGDHNKRAGFFFCVRANHITVRGCRHLLKCIPA